MLAKEYQEILKKWQNVVLIEWYPMLEGWDHFLVSVQWPKSTWNRIFCIKHFMKILPFSLILKYCLVLYCTTSILLHIPAIYFSFLLLKWYLSTSEIKKLRIKVLILLIWLETLLVSVKFLHECRLTHTDLKVRDEIYVHIYSIL